MALSLRVQSAKRLLDESDLPIPVVAKRAGFSSARRSTVGKALLDSCTGLAIQSMLDKSVSQTTLEFKISLVRPITPDTGQIRAEGVILSCGRRVGTAEGRVTDGKGARAWHNDVSHFPELRYRRSLFCSQFDRTMQDLTPSNYLRGAPYGLSAVCIWATFMVVSRLGVRTSLTPWDVAAIRFAVAGVILLPYLLKRGLALDRRGWGGFAAIVIGSGAPMVLLANAGLLFAPASHAGALFPGVMPLMVAILASVILNEEFILQKTSGFILIVLGAVGIVWTSSGTFGGSQNIGDLLFLCAGLTWAGYTVAMRCARLDGLHAAAISAVASLVLYLPANAIVARTSLLKAPALDVALEAVVQGVLTTIVALLLSAFLVLPVARPL